MKPHSYEPEHACPICGWHIVDENKKCLWCGGKNPKGRLKK